MGKCGAEATLQRTQLPNSPLIFASPTQFGPSHSTNAIPSSNVIRGTFKHAMTFLKSSAEVRLPTMPTLPLLEPRLFITSITHSGFWYCGKKDYSWIREEVVTRVTYYTLNAVVKCYCLPFIPILLAHFSTILFLKRLRGRTQRTPKEWKHDALRSQYRSSYSYTTRNSQYLEILLLSTRIRNSNPTQLSAILRYLKPAFGQFTISTCATTRSLEWSLGTS